MESKEGAKKEGQALYKKGIEAFNRNTYKEAVELLEQAAQILADKFSFFYLAETYANLKEHQKAIDMYDKAYAALQKEPKITKEHVLVLQCKAEEERHLGNYQKSIECYDTALDLAQKSMKAEELREIKFDLESGKQQVKKLIVDEERKKYVEALKQAQEMEKRKSYREAVELYTKCISLQEAAEGYFQRAQCYKAMGEFKEAIKDYAKCAELKKTSFKLDDNLIVKSLFFMGGCYVELGEFKQAVLIFKKAYEKIHYGDKYKDEIERAHKLATERMEV